MPWCVTDPKDTIIIPEGGYVVTRFWADNPGWWLIHCHIILHHAAGMAVAIKEGTDSQMDSPPADMPKCGPYDTKNYFQNGK